MRTAFVSSMLRRVTARDFVFLTGDLGFMALEPLRDAAPGRFLNAGIAEQNMISVAAGLAGEGTLKPWVYSIAPFLYARAFEQIRNDVCMHNLPVFLVGNGGGYAYGVMGPSHHALEDYGVLLQLPNLAVYVPAFATDLAEVVERISTRARPAYLRLGRDENRSAPGLPIVPTASGLPSLAALPMAGSSPLPPYAPWRRLLTGGGATVVAVGPLVGGLLAAARPVDEAERPNLWVLAELPIRGDTIPAELFADIERSGHLVVAEEHVAHGGAGESLVYALLTARRAPRRFSHRFALGYPSGLHGSQHFHRQECGLDPAAILALAASGRGTPL